jgi:PP-loop superfamily ATP-utilizing enzyme
MSGLVLAFSGGKDSTAMALGMAERGETFTLLFNVTGDELPDLVAHVARVRDLTGMPLEVTSAGFSLAQQIEHYHALPNQNMRWCTRELKIEPTVAWLSSRSGSTLCVGLRADEDAREGAATLYGPAITYRRPLREWGWGEAQVLAYLKAKGVTVPDRTDCALCYDQRLGEWYRLWREHPERYAKGEALEALTGHTFRSPTRDTWPASLREMRERFEAGDVPRTVRTLPLFGEYEERPRRRCRVCAD